MKSVTHLEKVITGEASVVTHLEQVIAQETAVVTYTEKVIAGEAPPVTHLQKVIAGIASPVTHLEHVWAGRTPEPTEHEYTGAVPVTFTADGTPLLDYIISGNTVQNGTPTPDNPIMPKGTGQKTANLLFKKIVNGGINPRGQVIESITYNLFVAKVTAGDTITASNFAEVYAFYGSEPATGSISIDNTRYITYDTPYTITIPNGAEYIAVRAYSTQDNTMLNLGSEALPYEPYGYKIPISSANTTTPVYLGEVQSTRKIKKLVLDGTEDWDIGGSGAGIRFFFNLSDAMAGDQSIIIVACTHFVGGVYGIVETTSGTCEINPYKNLRFNFSNIATTVPDWITWLQTQYAAGTPVTVWYVLTAEETDIVNEPLQKIGDYADTLSMEQAGVQIPTNNGSTTVDVDTELKPSEVYIKYKG